MDPKEHLEAIFVADRQARRAESLLLSETESATLEEVLASAVADALDSSDRDDAAARLERLADLCAQVPGPRMAETLIRILNDDDPAVRVGAGEALLDLSYERFADVADAIEAVVQRQLRGPAMAELPWMLAENGDDGAAALTQRFLDHPEEDVVAAAIEALAALGDPSSISLIKPFLRDERAVSFDDLEEETTVTLAELARAAIAELE